MINRVLVIHGIQTTRVINMQSSNNSNNIEIKQKHWSLKHMISGVTQEQEYRSPNNDLISGEIKQLDGTNPTLRVSSRIKITQRLRRMGFAPSKSDSSLFIRPSGIEPII